MKKFISLLLVLTMIVTITPELPGLNEVTAEASSTGITSDGYEYEVSDAGEVTITGYSGSATELVIPESIEGFPVKVIGNEAFYECSNITSVIIPMGVTSIGDYTFRWCSSLKSITIPESVTSIGYFTFGNCSSLTSITIPESVTSIGDRAFYSCGNLTSIAIPDGVTSIGDATFIFCSNLKSISIPESVISIGNRVFEGCVNLASVTIPKNVKSIGDGAFDNCDSLTGITIPKSVTNIGYGTFTSCNKLENVTLEEGLLTLGESMFSSCASLTSITIPGSVTRISDYAFYCCENLSSVTIEDGVSEIGIFTFFWSEKLTGITIPKSVKLIDTAAFYLSENITDVYYSGTEEQWSKIYIKEQNEPLLKATIHTSEATEEDNKESEDVEGSSSPVLGDNEAPFDDPQPTEPSTEAPTEAPTQAPTEPSTEAPTQESTEETTKEEESTEAFNGVIRIEAEDYDTMLGVALRGTQDQDSDVISSVDAGDYMIYTVNIPESATYRFNVRAARSDSGVSILSLIENENEIATCEIKQTGSWSTFDEFEGTEVYLEAGTHTFKVYAKGGRYNLNWYELLKVEETTEDVNGIILIEAEDYDTMSGVALRGTKEQGSDIISSVDAGDYMIYTVNVPVSGTYIFNVRAARSDAGISILNLMENDSVIATCSIGQTGSWSTFDEFEGTEVYLEAGTHTFKVYAKGGRYNLNWYKLIFKTESEDESTEAPSEEVLPDGSIFIEAENYDTMSGVALRDTQDQDSDVISSVDAGDYMIYEVNIPASGNYRFDVRAARSDSGLSVLSLMENNSTIATVNITSTGGWGTFAEFEGTECYLEAGTHTFKVYANGGRYNLNWYTLVYVEKEVVDDGSVLVEAEDYDSMSGVALRGTQEQGSDVISSVDAGDYMIYTVEVPTSGTYRFDVRAARSDSGTSLLNLMENDSVIASCGISTTGGWSTFSDFEGSEVYLTAGTHTFKVYAKGGRYNLNWYKLTSIEPDEAA